MRQVKRTQIFKTSAAHDYTAFSKLPFFASIDLSDHKTKAIFHPSDDEEDLASKAGVRALHLDFWEFVAKEAQELQWGLSL